MVPPLPLLPIESGPDPSVLTILDGNLRQSQEDSLWRIPTRVTDAKHALLEVSVVPPSLAGRSTISSPCSSKMLERSAVYDRPGPSSIPGDEKWSSARPHARAYCPLSIETAGQMEKTEGDRTTMDCRGVHVTRTQTEEFADC